jgi:hypothetical protein
VLSPLGVRPGPPATIHFFGSNSLQPMKQCLICSCLWGFEVYVSVESTFSSPGSTFELSGHTNCGRQDDDTLQKPGRLTSLATNWNPVAPFMKHHSASQPSAEMPFMKHHSRPSSLRLTPRCIKNCKPLFPDYTHISKGKHALSIMWSTRGRPRTETTSHVTAHCNALKQDQTELLTVIP